MEKSLESKLVEFYTTQLDAVRRRQLEQELQEFRNRQDALQLALQILEMSRNSVVQWFCAMILEDWVGRRWLTLAPAQHEHLRRFVLQYLTDTNRPLDSFVANKIGKVLIDIGKHAWPQEYPAMLEEIRSLCISPTTFSTGLMLLGMVAVEFTREDLMLPSQRKAELRRCLENEMPSILHLVVSLLAHSRDDRSFELASGAMACVASYVEAGCVPASLCQCVCEEVFKVLQGSDAQGRLLIHSQLGTEAIRVLTEVLNKRLVPPEQKGFVLSVAMNMCTILQGVARPGSDVSQASPSPPLASSLDEAQVNGLVEFINVFLDQHLGRILSEPSFPFRDFLVLLAEFSFALPDPPTLLHRCFLPWSTLLEHLSESEPGLKVLDDNSEVLSMFARALLEKMLFASNADALGQLDDEARPASAPEGEGEKGPQGQKLPEWDEDDVALPEERSEQQEVIGEGATLLKSLARLPRCSVVLSGQVLTLLQQALTQLEAATHARDMEQRRVDSCTLLSLVVVLVPQSPHDRYWSALRLVLDFSRKVTSARLFSRGAGWVALQCMAFGALRDLSQGFDAALAGGQSQEGSMVQGALSEMVEVVIASLDTTVVPAPEQLQREAAGLILAVVQRLPSDLLRACPAFQNLLQAPGAVPAYQRLIAPLPLPVKERMLQAISLLLLPNAGRGPGVDDDNVARAYAAFLSPLLRSLAEGQEQLATRADVPPGIRPAAGALRALCSLYNNTPKRIKQVLYNGLQPGLPAVLPCVSLTLSRLGRVTGSSGTARTLMNLLMALVVCFGKDLGPNFIVEALKVFTSLFSSADFLSGLSQQVATSKHRRTPSDSSTSSCAASTFVVASLLRLLTRIVSKRWSSASSFLPAICSLLLDQLLVLVRAAPTELMALFLDVTSALLSEHFRFFVASTANNRQLGMPEGAKRFTSPEAQEIFNRFMEVILECLRSTTLPPGTVRKAIDMLLHLSKSVSLFTVEHFRQTVGPAFTLALVDVLLSRTHPLLRDDICSLLYEMTVGTDPDAAIAHPILVHISGLSDVQKGGLLQTFPSDRDAPNFVKGLKAFLGDVEYLRLCNEAVGAS